MKKENPETPPPLWLQLLSLSLIFAIGVAAGWVVWGRDAKLAPAASSDGSGSGTRRIVLGTGSGGGGATASAARSAPSASLKRILQALTMVDADARFVEFIGALGEMKAEDALAVQQRLKEDFQPDKGPNREREALFRRWGEVDPKGAALRRGGVEELKRWFESIPSGTPTGRKFKQKAMQTVALHLDHRDAETVKQWLETQPPEPWRSSPAYALVAKNMAKKDRAAALNWLAALPPGAAPVGREAGKEIYRAWQEEKPEEAMQWMRTVSDQKFLTDITLKKAPGGR